MNRNLRDVCVCSVCRCFYKYIYSQYEPTIIVLVWPGLLVRLCVLPFIALGPEVCLRSA